MKGQADTVGIKINTFFKYIYELLLNNEICQIGEKKNTTNNDFVLNYFGMLENGESEAIAI